MYKILNFRAWFSSYLKTHVEWKVQASYDFPYIAIVKGDEWKIDTGDFPIEERYCLFINGDPKLEFSSWPNKYWGVEQEEKWFILIDELEKSKNNRAEQS